jgi:hypothetical protein
MRQINFALAAAIMAAILASGCAHDPIPEPANPPLVGTWFEESQLVNGQWIKPGEPIQQLRFDPDGSFSVTWHPFETYMDYWGHYDADPMSDRLVLTIKGGNYVPADFAGIAPRGFYSMDNRGRLVLSGISLGTPKGLDPAPRQAARFERSQP